MKPMGRVAFLPAGPARAGAVSVSVMAHVLGVSLLAAAALAVLVPPGEDPPVPFVPELRIITLLLEPSRGVTDAGGHDPSRAPARRPRAPAPAPPVAAPSVPAAPPPEPAPPELPGRAEEDGGGEGPPGEGWGAGSGTGKGQGSGEDPGKQGDPRGRGEGGNPYGEGPETLVVGGEVVAPQLLRRVEPEYPRMARLARVEGTVIFHCIIGTDGTVELVQVVRAAHPLLDAAAEKAVRAWLYSPSTRGGRPIKVSMTVTVEFRLR